MKKYFRSFAIVLTLLLSITLITGCSTDTSSNSKDKVVGLGETFTFDDLEITLGEDITFTKINNEWSEYNGKDVIKVPITVKNIKDETHSLNMFYYSFFGSQGTQLNSVSSYFDDGIDEAGDLRSGASYTKYFYFLYDGDGTYSIEFSGIWSSKITANFEVIK